MTTVTHMIGNDKIEDGAIDEKSSIFQEKGRNSPTVQPAVVSETFLVNEKERGIPLENKPTQEKNVSSSTNAEGLVCQSQESEQFTKEVWNKEEINSGKKVPLPGSRKKKENEDLNFSKSSPDGSEKRETVKAVFGSPIASGSDGKRTKSLSEEVRSPSFYSVESDGKTAASTKSRRKTSEHPISPVGSNSVTSPSRSKPLTPKSPVKRTRSSSSSDSPATEKRKKSSDNNDVEEVIREKSVTMLLKALGNKENVQTLAKAIEEAVYIEFNDANDHRYRSRIRSRVSNLNRNPAIGYQLVNGKIKPDRFARMTADELATRELKELREELESSIEDHLLPEREIVGNDNTKKSDNAV